MINRNVLIIDDEEGLRNLLSRLLTLDKYKVFEASNGEEGLKLLSQEDIHVIVLDVKLPGISGIDLIPKIKEYDNLVEIIVLTAYGTIQDGVTAIKRGAFDYITKGDEDNKILTAVEHAMQKANMSQRIEHLEKRVSEKYNFNNIIGKSLKIRETINLAKKAAETDVTVLLTGETGVGKEIFAQAIHNEGARSKYSFVPINCSAISKELLESEMFGYKAGAFTGAVKNKKGLFEEANEGTIFLDEIGDMDISLQSKILRVLETNSFIKAGDTKPTLVNVRVIAATNKNLNVEISKGTFRPDLFYRINTMKIEIPSLRDRKEDIPLFIQHYVNQYSQHMNKNIGEIDEKCIERLTRYSFPGNVRELRNIIERAIILTEGNILLPSSLPADLFSGNIIDSTPMMDKLDEVEKLHILKILEDTEGNKTKTAEILGIGLTTLYRKLKAYNID
ncbi:MAG: sigma-54 dependent transcriptional regulator [Ignavibacteriaceae bacterium]|nr:sigma-54 dependent transcriptional regulator [Ignavibacteriaceae bacterium]